jgi:hypothetical protein
METGKSMAKTFVRIICGISIGLPALAPATTYAEPPKLPVPAIDQSALGVRGYFLSAANTLVNPAKRSCRDRPTWRC